MSTRRRVISLALAIAGTAGLMALPWLWPGFSRYETAADAALWFGSGWISHANRVRGRQSR